MGGDNAEVALGKRLQQARQKAGLTQQELCHRTGMSYSTLAKIERGAIKAPSIFTIQNIANVLGISIEVLLGSPVAQSVQPKKTSKSGVKFVYFDINGCLVRFYHRAFARIAHDHNLSAEVVETAFWHFNDAVCRGEMTMAEFNQQFGDRIGVKNLDWAKYYLHAVDAIEEMKQTVVWASEHYYVGLLSNIMPGLIDAMLEQNILPSVAYTAIIDSSAVGANKPEKRIYEIAHERSGVQPSEILLIDDARTNLMAAEKMGWHVLWFDNYQPEESVKNVRQALEFS